MAWMMDYNPQTLAGCRYLSVPNRRNGLLVKYATVHLTYMVNFKTWYDK